MTDFVKARTTQSKVINKAFERLQQHATRPLTLGALEILQVTVAEAWEKLKTFHDKVVDTCQDEQAYAVQSTQMDVYLEVYLNFVTEACNIKTTLKVTEKAPPPTPGTTPQHLPKMDLPTFKGQYYDWPAFEDLFKTTIHNCPSLSDSQRLQYLKTCVQEEAAAVIRAFTVTDANYAAAWKLLSETYDRKREIVQSMIRKLLNQNSIKQDSLSSLQQLVNTTNEVIRSLEAMGRPVQHWDDLLVVIVLEKLDPDSKMEWANSLTGNNLPKFSELSTFLDKRMTALIARGPSKTQSATNQNQSQGNKIVKFQQTRARSNHVQASTTTTTGKQFPPCLLCKGTHALYRCPQLLATPQEKREEVVRTTSACLNCLRGGHQRQTCRSTNCLKCGERHHTLIHKSTVESTERTAPPHQSKGKSEPPPQQSTSANHASRDSKIDQSLLKTAIILIQDSFGNYRNVRILLDDGSESSFMTLTCAKSLGLQLLPADVVVTGLSSTTIQRVRYRVLVRLQSRLSNDYVDLEALLLPQVTGIIPRKKIDVSAWDHLQTLQLADPTFYKPGKVDILIGMDVLMTSVYLSGIQRGLPDFPVAQQTIFGWVVGGRISSDSSASIIATHHASCKLEEILRRFWEIEEPPSCKPLTKEEKECEEHFVRTHRRLPSGRYQVRLPTNEKIKLIGDSRKLAISRLLMLESRFRRNSAYQEAYKDFMEEYIQLGHMELVPERTIPGGLEKRTISGGLDERTIPGGLEFYIPHHFVKKEDSSTTKLRVVFDASMKSSTGVSLNDALKVGPVIQDELLALLIRFRLHRVVIKGDIGKMYRQFEVHPDDRDLQRVLWRSDPSQPIRVYRGTTLTYGTACAAFLATRCLVQLAHDEKDNFPIAAEVLPKDSYIDDLMSGEASDTGAASLVEELIGITAAGEMEMRKWCSNSREVMSGIPENLRETGSSLSFDNHSIKALGIRWEPEKDIFKFDVHVTTSRHQNLKKKELLGEIAKTFDPLGWLSPVTIRAKLLFQSLWKDNHGWSDFISDELQQQWDSYQQELSLISDLEIPRWVSYLPSTTFELHGFSDASERAYAGCVYFRIITSTTIKSNLLLCKAKLAPLKKRSIPRLELCGALLVAELITYVKNALLIPCSVHCWTDSMVVLHWLNSESRRWKTFVSNRVAEIQDLIPPQHWGHVRSEDNPADLPSRGIAVEELLQSQLWWHGPDWLTTPGLPQTQITVVPDDTGILEELPIPQIVLAARQEPVSIINYLFSLSSLERIVRYVAWIRRAVMHFAKKSEGPITMPLTPAERQAALMKIIQIVQQEVFREDIRHLQRHLSVSRSSNLIALTPFLDSAGIMRVGGRLERSAEEEGKIHPIILPKSHQFTTLVIRNLHFKLYHAGPTLLLSQLRRNYWIINGRNEVRKLVADCITCKKVKATTAQQLMGSLPAARVTASRPFSHSGVDLAGPFMVKLRRGRGSTGDKCWVVIFICFSTKAVHIDAVMDLSTESFMAAFKRFTSRRGIPSHMHSDCGTNFIGAKRILEQTLSVSLDQIQQQVAEIGTTWALNPPSAPHQGGLWEAAVKSAKFHLKRVMGDRLLTYEQFITVLCSVEACLNSRPICPLSSDPLDMDALTPGHFLIGQPLVSTPEPNVEFLRINRLSYWQEAQQISQHFWRRWKDEYLSTLQQRSKWQRKEENIRIGDLVIIREDNLPPTKWKLGRVIQTFQSEIDHLIRKVLVKTATGEVIRPIQKLSVLLKEEI